jgi:hypothetical protein
MTEDSAIRIDLHSTEVVHFTHPIRILIVWASSPHSNLCHEKHLSVFWIPGYPGPPAPGPLQQPSFGLEVNQRPKPNRQDPHEEAPHEENDD